jgi:hypothetical protein
MIIKVEKHIKNRVTPNIWASADEGQSWEVVPHPYLSKGRQGA